MEPRDPRYELYEAVRARLLALLGRDGVVGVVLVDRDGALVLHEGAEPHGDVAALAGARFAAARACEALLDREQTVRACLLTDARHVVLVVPAGRGARLLIYLDGSVPPGLAGRLLAADARRVSELLEPEAEAGA